MTDTYGLFGYPVTHSWSPFIHGMFARQTLQDISYRLLQTNLNEEKAADKKLTAIAERKVNVKAAS